MVSDLQVLQRTPFLFKALTSLVVMKSWETLFTIWTFNFRLCTADKMFCQMMRKNKAFAVGTRLFATPSWRHWARQWQGWRSVAGSVAGSRVGRGIAGLVAGSRVWSRGRGLGRNSERTYYCPSLYELSDARCQDTITIVKEKLQWKKGWEAKLPAADICSDTINNQFW